MVKKDVQMHASRAGSTVLIFWVGRGGKFPTVVSVPNAPCATKGRANNTI